MKNLLNLCMTVSVIALTACGSMSERLADVGKQPELTKISNPTTQKGYQPVSMPMPTPEPELRMANSLWSTNRQTFFKDQRARTVGDILTIMIDIDDEAEVKNETDRTRQNNESAQAPRLLGYEGALAEVLPETIDPTNLIDLGSDSSHAGRGKIKREDQIKLKLAAVVTQVLPNGNLVVSGRQEVTVNFEKRVLDLAGIIRPEDITIDNSIPYEKIAEARIAYGGKGQITDVQQPRYGQQVYDAVFPF